MLLTAPLVCFVECFHDEDAQWLLGVRKKDRASSLASGQTMVNKYRDTTTKSHKCRHRFAATIAALAFSGGPNTRRTHWR